MKTNFSQGEWSLPHFADPKSKCKCVYVLSEPYCGSICDISVDNGKPISEGGNDAPPLNEAIANAYLIHAAPDSFRALHGLLEKYVSLINSGDAGSWNPEEESEVIAARAALAKSIPPESNFTAAPTN